MARDHRIEQNVQRLDYTCANLRFRTNTVKGEHHGSDTSRARGSVFEEPLVSANGFSLWLEHVAATDDPNDECYWLMWYDENGWPAMPMSAILHRQDIAEMQRLLASFIP